MFYQKIILTDISDKISLGFILKDIINKISLKFILMDTLLKKFVLTVIVNIKLLNLF